MSGYTYSIETKCVLGNSRIAEIMCSDMAFWLRKIILFH